MKPTFSRAPASPFGAKLERSFQTEGDVYVSLRLDAETACLAISAATQCVAGEVLGGFAPHVASGRLSLPEAILLSGYHPDSSPYGIFPARRAGKIGQYSGGRGLLSIEVLDSGFARVEVSGPRDSSALSRAEALWEFMDAGQAPRIHEAYRLWAEDVLRPETEEERAEALSSFENKRNW